MTPSGADGLSDYQRIKANLPTGLMPLQTQGVIPIKYTLTKTADQVGRSCYTLQSQDFFTLTRNDQVQLCLAEGSAAIDSKTQLRCRQERMINGTLQFSF
jgi:hypothetical protein